jgi:nicotinamidase/pyrazinamidase
MARDCRPGCGSERVDQIDICGIATDYCVRATALYGVRESFDTTVLLDLTAAVAPRGVAEVSAELAAVGVAIRA